MSRTHIPRDLRERVAAQAQHRCGYCLTAEAIAGTPMEVDHIIPEARGGTTEEHNLWLACSLATITKAIGFSLLIRSAVRSSDSSIRVIKSGENIFDGRTTVT